MFKASPFLISLLAACVIAWLAPGACLAQSADSDTQEINRYVLTEAGLTHFAQATKNLDALEHPISGNCDDENPESLDEMVGRIDAVPGAAQAIEAAGMTSREYLVFSLSVFQNGMAAWALDQPGGELPPGMDMANVNFYRAHAAEIQQLGSESGSDGCDDEGNDDEQQGQDEEEWLESDG